MCLRVRILRARGFLRLKPGTRVSVSRQLAVARVRQKGVLNLWREAGAATVGFEESELVSDDWVETEHSKKAFLRAVAFEDTVHGI